MNTTIIRSYAASVALKIATLMAMAAIAGLVGVAWAYTSAERSITIEQRRAAIFDKFETIEKDAFVLNAINSGNFDDAKASCSIQMAEDVADIPSLVESGCNDLKDFAEVNCNRILRDEMAHPEHYLSADPASRNGEIAAWKTAGVEALKWNQIPVIRTAKTSLAGLAENN